MKVYNLRSRLVHIFFAFLLVCLGLTVLGTQAHAQFYHAHIGGPYGRVFPDEALRGKMEIVQYPYVILDGKQEMLVPGTRFIDTMNRVIFPTSIAGKRQVVNYIRHRDGRLHTIWLLTPKEIQERRKGADPKWWEKLYDSLEPWIDLAKWYGLGQLGL